MSMKKLLSLVLAVWCVCALCACGGSESGSAEKIKGAFAVPFEYSVTTHGITFNYTKTPELTEMVLTAPDTLNGLKVTRSASGVTASYDGLVVTLPESTARRLTALDDMITRLPDAVDSCEYAIESETGRRTLLFGDGGTTYTLVCTEDGTPVTAKIQTPEKTYDYTFSG